MQVAMWHETGLRALVTCIVRSPVDWEAFAVGYADGSVRIWNSKSQTVTVTFNGHKTAVSALAWDADGTRLATGAKDTDIIVWDVVGEVGLFRLRGHREQITALAFVAARPEGTEAATASTSAEPSSSTATTVSTAKPATHLLSSSKDTFIKLWNLTTQHCIETIVGHRSEAWSFAYDAASNVLVSGGGEGEVKCWKVDNDVLSSGVAAMVDEDTAAAAAAAPGKKKLKRAISPIAALSLPNPNHTHNITQISLHPTLPVLAIHSGERAIDVFRLRTEEELRKKLARRRRRDREKKEKGKAAKGKGKAKAVEGEDDDDAEMDSDEAVNDGEIEWRDRLAVWSTVRASGKVRSFSFAPETQKSKGEVQVRALSFRSSRFADIGAHISRRPSAQIMASLANNSLEVFNLPPPASSKAPAVEPIKLLSLDLPGHRSDVRCLAVSSDDQLIASASHGSLKLWNVKTTKCVRTMDCGYAICCSFLPGDRHVSHSRRRANLDKSGTH